MVEGGLLNTTSVLNHVRHLALSIGPRPSARPAVAAAGKYAERTLIAAGVSRVRQEPFRAVPSTYLPYSLTFLLGVAGTVLCLKWPSTVWAAAVVHGLAAWGFWAEANFEWNWQRLLLPRRKTQNVVGVIPARSEKRQMVVLVSHLDTHRMPIFFSNRTWLLLFNFLVGLAFVSLLLGAVVCVVIAAAGRAELRFLLLPGAAVQLFDLVLCLHADATPFSQGANDNASGVGVALSLAERLCLEPLSDTEVWVLLTDCEEMADQGMRAFLDAHGHELREALFVAVDMVGLGHPAIQTREGLLRSYRPDKGLVEIARRVAAASPDLGITEHKAGAYTDCGVVHKRGFKGIVVDSCPHPGHPAARLGGYWHQPTDTFDRLEPEALARAETFVWKLLHALNNAPDQRQTTV